MALSSTSMDYKHPNVWEYHLEERLSSLNLYYDRMNAHPLQYILYVSFRDSLLDCTQDVADNITHTNPKEEAFNCVAKWRRLGVTSASCFWYH